MTTDELILARGTVVSAGISYNLAGVTVNAELQAQSFFHSYESYSGETVVLASTVSGPDGAYILQALADPQVERFLCLLENCQDLSFQVRAFDRDGALVYSSEPLPYQPDRRLEISVGDSLPELDSLAWSELGQRIQTSQTIRLADIAVELSSLAPAGLFQDWTVLQRLAALQALEAAFLDPRGVLAEAGIVVTFARLRDPAQVVELRGQFPDQVELLDWALRRAQAFGGLQAADLFLEPEAFAQADVRRGLFGLLREDVEDVHPGPEGLGRLVDWERIGERFPWLRSPLVGYRDYLRAIWTQWIVNNTLTEAGAIQQLRNRFHQDFTTRDATEQPANQVLIKILTSILTGPTGSGYGFGLAPAAVPPQDDLSHREYLDALIGLTGERLEELENRYRLNLQRSDLETSNPVQQNIETLQRFFTDSFQSLEDPEPIQPPLHPNKAEPLINGVTRFRGFGPFFLEYEEWLERQEPFYAENHFDIRALFRFTVDRPDTLAAVKKNSVPLSDFVTNNFRERRFDPGDDGVYEHERMKWQWVRNFVDLDALVQAAHQDFQSLNYAAAEAKYSQAQHWVTKLKAFVGLWQNRRDWPGYPYSIFDTAHHQRTYQIRTIQDLKNFEGIYHANFSYRDYYSIGAKVWDKWFDDTRPVLAYLLDLLEYRLLPACLAEIQVTMGRYREAVSELSPVLQFYILSANRDERPGFYGTLTNHANMLPRHGALPFTTTSHTSHISTPFIPIIPEGFLPANPAELAFFRLKLGEAMLEWADALYRSNRPESIQRARELYKGVLYLHGEDPRISPLWGLRLFGLGDRDPLLPLLRSRRNPAVESQTSRAWIGFQGIQAGLNYYGLKPGYVPPVRYKVLREAADRFAASGKSAQTDFMNYMQKLDQATIEEMTARAIVEKAQAAIAIAQEQAQIAQYHVGEAQKQVNNVQAQIAAKRAEIADAESFFNQAVTFAKGVGGSVKNLYSAVDAQAFTMGDELNKTPTMGDLVKIATAKDAAAQASTLGLGAATMASFGAFVYAGYTSMESLAAASNKRAAELKALEGGALPAAKALLQLKQREVTITHLQEAVARADWSLGKSLLDYYAARFQNRSFWVNMSNFSNRLMRRYLDLAGRMAWFAERALAFEQDRELNVIAFDYFPRHLRGVTGADLLQLHLAELEATRIQGLSQTIPVKYTASLARDFPLQFGQLKQTGTCRFMTTEMPLRLAHPGVYGYRIRAVTLAASYAAPVPPHRGLLTNQGVSLLSRNEVKQPRLLLRYPDALPLSEFRLREDMLVYDLPDETLLPFEGSGIETVWELSLSPRGNGASLADLADVLITFDLRGSYSSALEEQHRHTLPATVQRSVLLSGHALNPGAIAKARQANTPFMLRFTLPHAGAGVPVLDNLGVILVGVDGAAPLAAQINASALPQAVDFTLQEGLALSNAGPLAGGNGGVPLPLNALAGLALDQELVLTLDPAVNPGVDFSGLRDALLWVDYQASL